MITLFQFATTDCCMIAFSDYIHIIRWRWCDGNYMMVRWRWSDDAMKRWSTDAMAMNRYYDGDDIKLKQTVITIAPSCHRLIVPSPSYNRSIDIQGDEAMVLCGPIHSIVVTVTTKSSQNWAATCPGKGNINTCIKYHFYSKHLIENPCFMTCSHIACYQISYIYYFLSS